MLKSRVAISILVVSCLTLVFAGTLYAATSFSKQTSNVVTPCSSTEGTKTDGESCPNSFSQSDGYTFDFCTISTTSVVLTATMQSGTDTSIGIVNCTDTNSQGSCASGEELFQCTVPWLNLNGSISWVAVADSDSDFQASGAFNTSPTAVSLSDFSGASGLALVLVLPLAVLGGVVYTKRKHQ